MKDETTDPPKDEDEDEDEDEEKGPENNSAGCPYLRSFMGLLVMIRLIFRRI